MGLRFERRMLVTLGWITLVGLLVIAFVMGMILRPRLAIERRVEFVRNDNALRDAIDRGGTLEEVSAMIKADPRLLSEFNWSGMTALHYAALRGRADLISLFIARGLDVNAPIVGEWGGPWQHTDHLRGKRRASGGNQGA